MAGLMEGPATALVQPSLVVDRPGWTIRVPGPVQRGQPDGALASAVVRSGPVGPVERASRLGCGFR